MSDPIDKLRPLVEIALHDLAADRGCTQDRLSVAVLRVCEDLARAAYLAGQRCHVRGVFDDEATPVVDVWKR